MEELTGVIPSKLMDRGEELAPRAAKNAMGKDDFLKLLMTQLQHQDPLNPMDQKDMSAQLAQFSSLEQLTNIGSGIKDLRSGFGDETKLNALSMIGRQVQASGSELELMEGKPVSVKLSSLTGDVKPTQVSIYDNSGKLVREMALDKKAVSGDVEWDGKDASGVDLPSGKYSFKAVGVDDQGQSKELNPELNGRVTGVDLDGKDAVLLVQTGRGTSKIEMSKIHHVSLDGPALAAPTAPQQAVSQPVARPQSAPPQMRAMPTGLPEPKVAEGENTEGPSEGSGMGDRANDWAVQRGYFGMPGGDVQGTFSRKE